jgi:hypothetical protein
MSGEFGDGVLRRPRKAFGAPINSTASVHAQRIEAQSTTVTPGQRKARSVRRSPEILEALRKIDTAPSPQAAAEIREWLQEVYDARGGGILLGLFGHCYLGPPHIDHVFDLAGQIIEHYTPAQTVPAVYLPARPFAVSEAYDYIEIYADGQIVPVRPDGSGVL